MQVNDSDESSECDCNAEENEPWRGTVGKAALLVEGNSGSGLQNSRKA